MMQLRSAGLLLALLGVALPVHAQWLKYPTPGLPRTSDGRPNLSAPAPRTPDGKQVRCLPEGPRFNHFPALPRKIVQTPALIVVLSAGLQTRLYGFLFARSKREVSM
jgi:hypothetical protein